MFGEDCWDNAEEERIDEAILHTDFSWAYLQGSDVEPQDVPAMPQQYVVSIGDLASYLSRPDLSGTVDVMQIFGGQSGVSRVAVRGCLCTGQNFDFVTRFNSLSPKDFAALKGYVRVHRPYVMVMGPPRTAFGNWCRPSRFLHLETWKRTRVIGEHLASLLAALAHHQLFHGRYFPIENRAGSEMFLSDPLAKVRRTGRVFAVNFRCVQLGYVFLMHCFATTLCCVRPAWFF